MELAQDLGSLQDNTASCFQGWYLMLWNSVVNKSVCSLFIFLLETLRERWKWVWEKIMG